MSKKFLDKVYDARTPGETRALYDDWSDSYEAEVAENGYATPARCAAALANCMTDKTAPVLDFGCGTGLSGQAMFDAGLTTLHGVDLSDDMLAVAKDKGLYQSLERIEAGADLTHSPGDFAAIAAVGVIGAGAAPISVLDTLLDGLAPGGLLVLSFNDHALEDPKNQGRIDHHLGTGTARQVFLEYGPHLPGIGLKSNVYVLEKT